MNAAKKNLQQIRQYDLIINDKLEELIRLHALATKITSSLKPDVVQTSGNNDKISSAVEKILTFEEEIKDCVNQYLSRKSKIVEILSRVDDPDQYDVLFKRYVLYKSWKQIAEEKQFSERWVISLHGRGLQKVDEILKDNTLIP